jgi:exonuclease VII small subunit
MDISNNNGGINSGKLVDYFTKQFLKDLGEMAELRAELEARQGALSAVDDANKLRTDAEAYTAAKKAEADDNLLAAKLKNAEADIRNINLDKALAAFEVTAKTAKIANEELDAREKSLSGRLKSLVESEAAVAKANEKADALLATLEADRATLDARIKAFQAKVAAINV